jgi:hypothetical protein
MHAGKWQWCAHTFYCDQRLRQSEQATSAEPALELQHIAPQKKQLIAATRRQRAVNVDAASPRHHRQLVTKSQSQSHVTKLQYTQADAVGLLRYGNTGSAEVLSTVRPLTDGPKK